MQRRKEKNTRLAKIFLRHRVKIKFNGISERTRVQLINVRVGTVSAGSGGRTELLLLAT